VAAELSGRARNRWLAYGSYVCIRTTLELRPMKVALCCCFVLQARIYVHVSGMTNTADPGVHASGWAVQSCADYVLLRDI